MIQMTGCMDSLRHAFESNSSGLTARFNAASTSGHAELYGGRGGARQTRMLKTGENLFMQGDEVQSICILRDGWAFCYQCLEDGRRQIVDFVLPGDVLGIGSSSRMPYGVEALSPCTWTAISRYDFMAELQRQPGSAVELLDKMSVGQIRAFEQMTSMGRRTARERVAHLLLDLACRVRKSVSNCQGVEITMPLMLSHLGDALGLATETVCRCVGELKRAGILVFGAGRLEILDLEGLSKLVGVALEQGEAVADARHSRRLVA